ncbi:MAG: TIGR03620 family F420-dependent LLM class oxidoreductase [Deltaproteobacteria bacterium]|nr:TIGR03620 family F420-dependent LLM class oxidoreductase [Deltaproteobacteria bacterium]
MMKIGKIGIWCWHDAMSIDESVAFVQKVEACGYGALWIPEAVGRDPFTHLAYLASKTSSLVLATGIANIWARDAMTMAAAQKTLVEISGNRFLLGMGISHAPLVEGLRGHRYHKPLTHMRQFLEKMAEASYQAPPPAEKPPVVLAALRHKMLALAREKTDGAHTYFVPPAHTRKARKILGADKLLAPAQAVILETNPAKARAAARNYMKTYVPRLPNYKNNLLELGYTEADFADGCSDHLVDDIVAWGDLDTIKARIQAHYDAGANHVCIMPLSSEGRRPSMAAVEAFAP